MCRELNGERIMLGGTEHSDQASHKSLDNSYVVHTCLNKWLTSQLTEAGASGKDSRLTE